MNILIVSQYFYPENFRINDIAASLIERGHKVTALTAIPNYPKGTFFEGYGYTKKRKDTYKGVNIIRLPVIPRLKGKLMLAINYYSFMVCGKFWARFYKKEKFDLVYVYEISPITMVFPAIDYAKRNKIPVVFNVIDLWPESLEFVNIKNKLIVNHFKKVADKAYRKSDLILTTSKSFMERIKERNINPDKIKFIPPYCEDVYKPLSREENSKYREIFKNKFNLVFTGNIGHGQGLEKVIKAISELNIDDILFTIIGDGRAKEELQKLVEENKIGDKVQFLGKYPIEEVPKLLAFADVGIICLKEGGLSELVIPAKLQSYMACGIPLISYASGELNDIINEAECGLISPSGEIEILKRNLLKMYSMSIDKRKEMSDNALKYFKEHYIREKVLNQMEKAFVDAYQKYNNHYFIAKQDQNKKKKKNKKNSC